MSQPKKKVKYRIRWKNVLLLVVALALVIYLFSLLIGLIRGAFSKEEGAFTACSLSAKKLRTQFAEKEYDSTAEINDYVFYGEFLNLYSSEYSKGASSNLTGRTLVLRNVCNGKEITIDKTTTMLDGQMDLRGIPEGFYEVYLIENLLEKRLYMANPIEAASIITVPRDKTRYEVTLYADAKLMNSEKSTENVLDKNYVFLDVRKVKNLPEDVYDIVLNPGPVTEKSRDDLTGNGLTESEEMFRFASEVKKKLEADGYKVFLTRDQFDWAGMYGVGGVAESAYKSKGKYFFSFDMYDGTPQTGVGVTYSSYISDTLAKTIFDTLVTEGGMALKNGEYSVSSSDRIDGGYDGDYDIRETGGKALGAGKADANSEMDTFAVDANGLQSLYFSLCNIALAEDAKAWTDHFDQYAQAMAKGIETYLNAVKP
ncbi:MAG: N-acetylmuramoyl-L-alanine amidase [Erysipelotrichales bacterium]|nr:N-acetylmuramoyl-L-alanine amidase [Erysipelotrichales bacterium]MBQ4011726.1 N-acetylmuramoyl-L-alanine amidase [Erysipelotrichales bacterium]MBQ4375501.1 N-acetylmuramoyl-L-alanine amidase [Erysipelotrichales bacterium]